MGLDKRMKKRIQQIDKNLDAIVKNPYEKKEIIEKKPTSFPSWTRWALPLGGALLTCSLALGILIPTAIMGKGNVATAAEATNSNGKERPQGSAATASDKTPTKGNPKDYDEYQEGTYVHENLNRLITPTHQQTRSGINGMSLTTYNSYKAFAKKFVTLMMDVNNSTNEKSLAISIPDAYIALAIAGIISDQNGLQDVLDYLELDNVQALRTATKQIVANLGTMTKDYDGNDVGGLNLNSIWVNPEKMTLLQERDEELYKDLRDIYDASLYMDALTSNRAMQYIAENGLPDKPVPNIHLNDDDPAAMSIMSVYYDIDTFEDSRYYEYEYLSGTHLMNYTCNGQTKRVDYIKQSNEHSCIYEGDNLTGATLHLDNSYINFFLPKDETAMPSTIFEDVLNSDYSPKVVTYTKDGEERTADTYKVDISAPYFFMNNEASLIYDDLAPIFPHLTVGGAGSRLAVSARGLPVILASIQQFSTMRFDYNGFYSCSATIVSFEDMSGWTDPTKVEFVLDRPYVFERSKAIQIGDSVLEIPIIVGEIVDPNYLV